MPTDASTDVNFVVRKRTKHALPIDVSLFPSSAFTQRLWLPDVKVAVRFYCTVAKGENEEVSFLSLPVHLRFVLEACTHADAYVYSCRRQQPKP